MEVLAFLLFSTGKILLMAIMTFLMAIPSGMGLGIGLNIVKKYFIKKTKSKSTEERANELEELFTQAAGAQA